MAKSDDIIKLKEQIETIIGEISQRRDRLWEIENELADLIAAVDSGIEELQAGVVYIEDGIEIISQLF